MDATEFTENGKGATLSALIFALHETPLRASLAMRHLCALQRLGISNTALCSNIILRPGIPLTPADLDRIARAEA